MLSRIEKCNDPTAVRRKEAELRREGFCEANPDELPRHLEYRQFSFAEGGTITYVIEWEDEVPVGSRITVHAD